MEGKGRAAVDLRIRRGTGQRGGSDAAGRGAGETDTASRRGWGPSPGVGGKVRPLRRGNLSLTPIVHWHVHTRHLVIPHPASDRLLVSLGSATRQDQLFREADAGLRQVRC